MSGRIPIAVRFAFAAWCAASSIQPAAQAQDTAAARRICPMDVPDTSVFTLALEGGAEGLAFVAPARVDELRERVHALAELQNRGSAAERVTATVAAIEGGAVLTFHLGEAAGPDELQGDVLTYAQRLAGGDCPMTRDRSAVVPARKPRAVPAQAPLAVSTVPGISAGAGVPTFVTSIPTAVGF
jgi:hypothetical protein